MAVFWEKLVRFIVAAIFSNSTVSNAFPKTALPASAVTHMDASPFSWTNPIAKLEALVSYPSCAEGLMEQIESCLSLARFRAA